jgi:hypothetical protein
MTTPTVISKAFYRAQSLKRSNLVDFYEKWITDKRWSVARDRLRTLGMAAAFFLGILALVAACVYFTPLIGIG